MLRILVLFTPMEDLELTKHEIVASSMLLVVILHLLQSWKSLDKLRFYFSK